MTKKTRLFTMLAFILILVASLIASDASAYRVEITNYEVTIVTTGDILKVTEDIDLKNIGPDDLTMLKIWIQKEAQEPISIISVDHNAKLAPIINGNTYNCNLTLYNLTIKKDEAHHIRVTYNLPVYTTNYEKRTLYDTSIVSVTLDDRVIGRFESVSSDALLSLSLYKPVEPPIHPLYLMFILSLVVIIILMMLIFLKRQRTKTKKMDALESDELLNIKKTLLLSILKEIEKMHRAKEISDDTYNKIKEQYKQQAVDVMKRIEDRKNHRLKFFI